MRRSWIASLAAGAMTAGASAGGVAPSLLNGLNEGEWELRLRDNSGVQRLCLADRSRLIQLRHQDLPCDHIVIDNQPANLVVQYTCPGRGFGRTTIRRESAQLVQLESQGIANGLPFDFTAEGRRAGPCRS
jgi:hypothetical protein